jgi:CubicO group peptidase (beta-lactamase class C family)
MVRLRQSAAVLAAVLALSCGVREASIAPAALAPEVYPGAEWERIDPASAGYCQPGLDRVAARAAELPTTALMAVAGGRVLFEYGDVRAVTYLASVRKSVLAMLYGKYVENGRIRLERTLEELKIDDIGGLLPIEKQATVADLLGARSGVYHEASNPGDNLADAPPRGSQKPGTYFLYSNWDFNALGTIFEQETGQSIYDALEQDLARPIGMQEFDRASHRRQGDATRSIHLAYHMNFSTRDMARLGYLMLRQGRWKESQVVPQAWARRIVRPVTPVADMNPAGLKRGPFGYGYLWWVWDGPAKNGAYEGAYTGMGAFGQYITVLPALDLVVAHKTRPGEASVSTTQYLELLDLLIGARCAPSSPFLLR